MRPVLVALMLMVGLMVTAEAALASVYGPARVYVPGHIRDGFYIRPHFVSTPKLKWGVSPVEPHVAPKPQPPVLEFAPGTEQEKLGEPS